MAINHECYVSLEVAKLLKQAGFDWECSSLYTSDGEFKHLLYDTIDWDYGEVDWNNVTCKKISYMGIKGLEGGYSAPTLEVAQRWLREVKGYYVAWEFNMNISPWGSELYDFADISVYIFVDSERGNICKCRLKENYKTVEDAQEAGIKKVVEMILEKGK